MRHELKPRRFADGSACWLVACLWLLGCVQMLGTASATATVTLWGPSGSYGLTSRRGMCFWGEFSLNNSQPVHAAITNTVCTHNNAGDLASVTYSDGATPGLAYGYDRRGRRTSVTQGGTITTTRGYDDAGNLLSESWSGGPLNGVAVTNGFDSLLRRAAVGMAGQPSTLVNYGYDSASRLRWVTNGSAYVGYTYLANSPLVSQIGFTNVGAWMATTKQHDYLNRLTSISSVSSASSVVSFSYRYNNANLRTAITNADNSRWVYTYDSLGQLTSGKRYWDDGTVVAGQQYEYAFDDIGNRRTADSGGDQNGVNLRRQTYTPNNLNQYASRTAPGYVQTLGTANASATVSLWGPSGSYAATSRKGDYYWGELLLPGSGPFYASITNLAVRANGSNPDVVSSINRTNFVPASPEGFLYDLDGNLTSDGRWNFTWDGENRLVRMVANTAVGPQQRLDFEYDWQGRRINKKVWDNTAGSGNPTTDLRFLYDGWNLIAILNPQSSVVESFVWGTDLSGSLQGAGGVGGLLKVTYNGAQTTNCFAAFDDNGNVTGLIDAANGSIVAQYEYGPFGELLRATEPMAKANPFRFSTKYQDDETDLLCYGHRYYSSSTGRWLSVDPLGESSALNLHLLLENDPLNLTDYLGLSWWKKYRLLETTGQLLLDNGRVLTLRNWKFRNKSVTIETLRECGSRVSEARLQRLERRYGRDFKIRFDEAAQPDFSPFLRAEPVQIRATGKHAIDSERAWTKLEGIIGRTREEIAREFGDVKLNWHHAGDGRMELIDRDLNIAIAHTGEAAAMRASIGETLAGLAVPGVVRLYKEKVEKGVCSCHEAFLVTFADGARFVDPGFEDAGELLWHGTRAAAKREVERALQGKPAPFNPGPKW